MVKKGSGSSKKKNISKKKGEDAEKIASSPDISEKPPEKPQKKPKLAELLLRKFDAPRPEKLFSVTCDEAYYKGITSPPFVSSTDKAEIGRIHNLLFLKFDISTFPMKEPKKPMTIQELLALKFDEWHPETLFSVPCERKDVVPPPFVSSTDDTEIRRIRQLLSLKFDISEFPMVMPLPPQPVIPKAEPEPGYRPPVEKHEIGQASVEYTPPPTSKQDKKGSDPMEKTMKYFIASLVAVFVLIIGASMSNVSDYYLVPKGQSLEVWKGIFAPLGKKLVVKMTGVQRPAEIKETYTQDEIYPMIFNYFINKADALLEREGMPDFAEVKNTLNTAMKYAVNNENRMLAQSRLTSIDLIVLLYKADIATSKGTVGDLKAAMGYLEKAMKLRLDAHQADLVKQRIAVTQAILDNAQSAPAVPAPKAEPVTEKASQPKEAAPKDDLQSVIKKSLEN